MNTLQFFVAGIPAPAGSKKAFALRKGGAFTGRTIVTDACKRTKPWQSDVKHVVSSSYTGPVLEGPLRVTFTFQLHRPKGHYGSGKNSEMVKASAPEHPCVMPDVLKLARAVEDALTGIVWRDDAQIVQEILAKEYVSAGQKTGVWITVVEPEKTVFQNPPQSVMAHAS